MTTLGRSITTMPSSDPIPAVRCGVGTDPSRASGHHLKLEETTP